MSLIENARTATVGEASGERGGPARRARATVSESAAAVVVAVVVSGLLQAVLARLPAPVPSELPRAVLALGALVVVAGILILALRGGRFGLARNLGAWVGLSALSTLGLALPLHGTLHYLGGTTVDQEFRLQFLTRLTASPSLLDMNFADLPTYYPAGWFWVGGRLADIAGIPAWEAYKPFAIATLAVVAAVAHTVWARLVGPRTGVLIATAVALVGLRVGAYEPYSWCVAAFLPAISVITWRALQRRGTGVALAGTGLFIGVAAATYTLFAGLAAALVVLLAAAAVATGRVSAGAALARVALVALAALPMTLLQWAGFLVVSFRDGPAAGAATRFLPGGSAHLPTPFLDPTVLGVLALTGLVWITARARLDARAQALGLLTVLCYAWYGLSTVAVAAGQTLLAFRVEQVVLTTFACAGVLGLAALRRALPAVAPPRFVATAGSVATVVALMATVSVVQTVPVNTEAFSSYYPSGMTPRGEGDPARPEYWNNEVIAAAEHLSGRSAEGVVLLTAYGQMRAFAPFRGYLTSTPHYANPLARYDERVDRVTEWSASRTPEELTAALDRDPVRAPNVFVLRFTTDGLWLPVSRDAFPGEPNVRFTELRFDPALFAGPQFRSERVGPFLVAART